MMAQQTILIVDDEANQRLMLMQALRTDEDRVIATALGFGGVGVA